MFQKLSGQCVANQWQTRGISKIFRVICGKLVANQWQTRGKLEANQRHVINYSINPWQISGVANQRLWQAVFSRSWQIRGMASFNTNSVANQRRGKLRAWQTRGMANQRHLVLENEANQWAWQTKGVANQRHGKLEKLKSEKVRANQWRGKLSYEKCGQNRGRGKLVARVPAEVWFTLDISSKYINV